jgi:hypothetical protein
VATAPRDLINTFIRRDEDGQVTLVDAGTKRAPKVVVAAYLREGRGPVLDRTSLGGRLLRRSPGLTPTSVEEELVDGQVLDAAMTRRTADVLGELDYDLVAFTHGPEIRTGAREAVRGFLAARRERDLARGSRRATSEDA